ncbi:MAG: hypothetical protein HY052_02395 [Proteobacteria bacterium]|nr:hypothetical protein [Pseudomonadota bacterium]
MSPEDKQKLKKAFTEAISRNPHADEAVTGWFTDEGKPITHRQLIENTFVGEYFYREVDQLVAKGEYTLDEYIAGWVSQLEGRKNEGPKH